jgi:hypothetical protein
MMMEVEECVDFAGGLLLDSLQEKLRVQFEGRTIYIFVLKHIIIYII